MNSSVIALSMSNIFEYKIGNTSPTFAKNRYYLDVFIV